MENQKYVKMLVYKKYHVDYLNFWELKFFSYVKIGPPSSIQQTLSIRYGVTEVCALHNYTDKFAVPPMKHSVQFMYYHSF